MIIGEYGTKVQHFFHAPQGLHQTISGGFKSDFKKHVGSFCNIICIIINQIFFGEVCIPRQSLGMRFEMLVEGDGWICPGNSPWLKFPTFPRLFELKRCFDNYCFTNKLCVKNRCLLFIIFYTELVVQS